MPSFYKCKNCERVGFPEISISIFGNKHNKCPSCGEERIELIYKCDECGYEGKHFKLTFLDAISSLAGYYHPYLNLEQRMKICPNCGKRSILDIKNGPVSLTASKEDGFWTTKNIWIVILIVFVMVAVTFFSTV